MSSTLFTPAASALLFLLALGVAATLILALRGGLANLLGRRPRRLAVLERLELGDRKSLLLVRIDSTEMVLGTTAQGVSLLLSLGPDRGPLGARGEPAASPCPVACETAP